MYQRRRLAYNPFLSSCAPSSSVVLDANLLAAPCLTENPSHEVIAIRGAPSAAAGLSTGIDRSRNDLIVCLHQDVSSRSDGIASPSTSTASLSGGSDRSAWQGCMGLARCQSASMPVKFEKSTTASVLAGSRTAVGS